MRDRDGANKNEIEIFVFSVTSNDFPHDVLLLTFSRAHFFIESRLKTMVPTLPSSKSGSKPNAIGAEHNEADAA